MLVAVLVTADDASAQGTLGFTIDPTSGRPGDTVDGQVNPADVAANCVTTVEGLSAVFGELFEGPFVSGNTVGELPQTFFPDPNAQVYENADQMSYVLTLFAILGISANIGGAAEGALPQTFVMTFADLATQTPIGQRGSFDPTTGVGSVVVPSLDPGIAPVVATCVGPIFDVAELADGIRAGGAFLESIGIQFGPDGPSSPEFEDFARAFLGSEASGFELIIEFVQAIGPDLLVNILEPQALGLQLFTVLPPLVNHFQCYDLRNVRFPTRTVTLTDAFGTRTAEVRRATDLCAPADKNGEDPDAPGDGNHLAAYQLKNGPFTPIRGQVVTNQFGNLTLDIRQQRSLLVPSSFSDSGPPSSPDGAFLSHFSCYDVRVTNRTPAFAPRTVSVQTAFDDVDVTLRKPTRLCVPTSKNGETPNAPTFPESLLCYQTRVKGAFALPGFFANQFGEQANTLRQRRDFCVPSQLGGSPAGAFVG